MGVAQKINSSSIMMKIIAFLFFFEVFHFSNGNPTGDDRIVNGEDAVPGQFPHQVLWAYSGQVFCGGSIYSNNKIITAAHCCKPFEDGEQLHDQLSLTNIVAGRIILEFDFNGQEISVKSYLIHPNYTGVDPIDGSGSHANDICLLTLDDDLEFNDNVKGIALNNETVEVGVKCIVSGWGTTTEGGNTAATLQFVEVYLWSTDRCNTAFMGYDTQIDPIAEICAYDEK